MATTKRSSQSLSEGKDEEQMAAMEATTPQLQPVAEQPEGAPEEVKNAGGVADDVVAEDVTEDVAEAEAEVEAEAEAEDASVPSRTTWSTQDTERELKKLTPFQGAETFFLEALQAPGTCYVAPDVPETTLATLLHVSPIVPL
jgi:hypothetical protein